jgi:hypothetical protein
MQTIIRSVGALLIMLTLAVVVHSLIWGAPALQYKLQLPSTDSECASVHPGMTPTELEEFVHSRGWPTEESLSETEFSFGGSEICQVELDPQTHRAVRAKMFQSPIKYTGDDR